jgi:hypothetical protein
LILGQSAIGGLHGPQAHHHDCDWCKSWVFTRIEPDVGFVNVRATMLDDASWFLPFVETYTSDALSWPKTPAIRSYSHFQPMEAYAALMTEYASRASA